MKKVIFMLLIACAFSFQGFATNGVVKSIEKSKIEKIQKKDVSIKSIQLVKVKSKYLILVTIETTCGATTQFYFQPAPGASQESMEQDLASEATGWNYYLCGEVYFDWMFEWS